MKASQNPVSQTWQSGADERRSIFGARSDARADGASARSSCACSFTSISRSACMERKVASPSASFPLKHAGCRVNASATVLSSARFIVILLSLLVRLCPMSTMDRKSTVSEDAQSGLLPLNR